MKEQTETALAQGSRRDGFLGQKGRVWTMSSTGEQSRTISFLNQGQCVSLCLPWQTALLLMSRSLMLLGGTSLLLPALMSHFPGDPSIKAASVHISPILLPLTKSVLVYPVFLSSHSDLASCSWGFENCFRETWTSRHHSFYGNLLRFIRNI